MIKDGPTLRLFEEDLVRKGSQSTFQQALGIHPLSEPQDGIEADIELARVLNCLKNSWAEKMVLPIKPFCAYFRKSASFFIPSLIWSTSIPE